MSFEKRVTLIINFEKMEYLLLKKKESEIKSKTVNLVGVLDMGLFLENCFLKRYSTEKTKNYFRKEVKKNVLKNLLVTAYRGEIDIAEVFKYLTKG